jgi:cell wall-associated NlpC family hydrolase
MLRTPDTLREEWVKALRSYEGTRFRHLGRSRQGGVDCAGLLICATEDVGINNNSRSIVKNYARTPDDEMFTDVLSGFAYPMAYNRLHGILDQFLPGDILSFWIDAPGHPRHLSVITGSDRIGRTTMIHSYARRDRGVIECSIDAAYWLPRIHQVWRLNELSQV